MKELHIDETPKWNMIELRQILTADPVGIWAESHASTLYSSIVYSHDFLSLPMEKLYAFGANPSSSIFRAHLYTTPLSMKPAKEYVVSRMLIKFAVV